VYPMPIGLVAEYNVGRGPEFNKITDSIEVQRLKGGYIQAMYNVKVNNHTLLPFIRYQYYDGGKKHERDARSHQVNDLEIGVEWQPVKQFELVAMYTISKRRYEVFILQNNLQQ
ncbi:MAG: porin, partial [Sphingobacteriales bacterium]